MSFELELEVLRGKYRALKTVLMEIDDEELAAARSRARVRKAEAKAELAREFRVLHEAGVPKYKLQDVIGTRNWATWKEWEELGGIRSAVELRGEELSRNSPYVWSADYATLTVRKNTRGEDIVPLVYDMGTKRKDAAGRWYAVAADAVLEREVALDDRGFFKALHDEIQRQIDEGNVAE